MDAAFPALPSDLEPTRATLHAYSHAIAALPRAHAVAHPQWWHASLKVRPEGLVTDPIPLPGGATLGLRMDLRHHQIVVRSSDGAESRFEMSTGLTGSEMGDRIVAAAGDLGLDGEVDRSRFEDDAGRAYDPAAAAAYFDAFTAATVTLERHRSALGSRVGPVQVWPHGFDVAFEWFGTGPIDHDGAEARPQVNFGFYPAGEPYFYSSPWPFDSDLTKVRLPGGATWSSAWNGATLPYDLVRTADDPGGRLLEFFEAVYRTAAPGLEA